MVAVRPALAAFVLVACNEVAGVPDASEPDATSIALRLEPDVLLDFGPIESDRESSREVTVHAIGGEALLVDSVQLVAGSPRKWRVEADAALSSGVAPGESASIRIHFRSCPEAWIGDEIDPSFDITSCYGQVAAGAIELESNAGRHSLSLAGRAAQPPQRLDAQPRDGLQFFWDTRLPVTWTWLNLTNTGHADLLLKEIELVQESPYFRFMEGCQSLCAPDFTLCSFEREGCLTPVYSLPVALYQPAPATGLEATAQLVIRSNDPTTPELILPIEARELACALPSPRIDQSRFSVGVNQPIVLDASQSRLGGPAGVYRWSWIHTSTTAPALSATNQRTVTFIPTLPGLYAIGLDLQNDCGWSQTPHIAVIHVREN